jgi:hypothetical protein
MLDGITVSLHYSRAGRPVSLSRRGVFWIAQTLLTATGLCAILPACAQYPGQITKKDKDTPSLRAVAVLEWTGDLGKPKTCRLVPVTVFDGEQLQDGGVYLARPQPLAVDGGVEYVLQKNGTRIGLFDVQNSGQEEGSWVGFGSWKPMVSTKPKPAPEMADSKIDGEESDRPTLHRKKGSADTSDSSSGSSSGGQAPAADPDRPTLHKKTGDDDAGNTSSSSAPASDSDKPTLHKSGSSDDSSNTQSSDPDRPTLKRGKETKKAADEGYVESLSSVTDPDRPHLMRGKSTGGGPEVAPTLVGLPSDLEQAVAVSDPRNRPEHPWGYAWADPADESKMKANLEDIARAALGIKPLAAPLAKRTTTKTKAKPAQPLPPVPLADEQFRVFELAYGSGATLVLTAHTDAPATQQKFVTLIAQPDLYGSLLVLFKSITDAAHLDDTPRMRLVDAVDALADNRGELLFELRGETQRQFALYRIMRGTADKLFVTGGGAFGSQAMN